MVGYSNAEYDNSFGFNSFEKDDEIKGDGNHISFEDYGFDPRIVRRFRLDPLMQKYPYESNYVLVSNNPIVYKDEKGEDKVITYIIKSEVGTLTRTVVQKNIVEFGVEKYATGMGTSWRATAYNLNQTIFFDMTTGEESIGKLTRGTTIGFREGFKQRSESLACNGESFKNRGGWNFTASDVVGTSGQTTKNKSVEFSDIGTLMTYLGASKFGIKALVDIKKNPREVVNQFKKLSKAINEKKAVEKVPEIEVKKDTIVSIIRIQEVKIDGWGNKSQYSKIKDTSLKKEDLEKLKENEKVGPALNLKPK